MAAATNSTNSVITTMRVPLRTVTEANRTCRAAPSGGEVHLELLPVRQEHQEEQDQPDHAHDQSDPAQDDPRDRKAAAGLRSMGLVDLADGLVAEHEGE